ncbi:MAG TPA: TRL-like family protein [Candidatus Binataceae bacterium]|nr:TRL-like family protein [Candidatus Binataceae bacterium]
MSSRADGSRSNPRNAIKLTLIGLALCSIAGCMNVRTPALGLLYTDVKGPINATSAKTPPTKTGTGCDTSILGVVATGDASIASAKNSAGITEVVSVDDASYSLLGGIYGTYCVTVRGN